MTHRFKGLVAFALAYPILAAGCSGGERLVEAGAPGEFAGASLAAEAERFGACEPGNDPWTDPDVHRDFPPPLETLVDYTDVWAHVDLDSIASFLQQGPTEIAQVDMTMNTALDATIEPVSSVDSQGASKSTRLRIHAKFAPGMRWALEHPGAEVFLGLHPPLSGQYPGETEPTDFVVWFAVVLGSDGGAFFAGECFYQRFFRTLYEEFGSAFDERVAGMVGKTGADLATAMGLDLTPPAPPTTAPEDRNLSPGEASDELLSSLEAVWVKFAYPDGWVADWEVEPYLLIITRISEGWNAGISLHEPASRAPDVDAYLNSTRELQIWAQHIDGDTRTEQLLGTVTVPPTPEQIGIYFYPITLDGNYDPATGLIEDPKTSIEPAVDYHSVPD
ncbi:MAG: hypothetical protein M5T61_04280 [Acidimicrobiia bacterium]|nr:hypothetical protein [Acidimicrobiia bacterium]